ncbi:Zn(2)-C6 fungal-type domain-containing protein [Favolaschia claudopus]|uniref:Zn(2)-C6 fungal-type domain-containing protein n=1 Tax=Favolaschia claudopus TaxID=2862362 RepID=A0AAW0CWV2_9AGAR
MPKDSETSQAGRTRGRDVNPRRPRTEAHFEALKKRAEAQQSYIERLEKMLAKCVCQHIDKHPQTLPTRLVEHYANEELGSTTDPETPSSDEDITRELTVPIQRLKLDDSIGNLVLHGVPTSPFRFRAKVAGEASNLAEVVAGSDATYILQLDGVNVSQPEIEWSRHLPSEVILNRREHDKSLHRSFSFYTMFALRVVPSLFLRDMYRALSVSRLEKPVKTSHYSPMLHNALLSMAMLFSDNPTLRDRKTRQRFVDTAKALANEEYPKPDISLVQALAFLASFYADCGERIQSEMFAVQSSRLSVTLGLGMDATSWVKAGLISEEERAERNRAHWTIFCLDVTWALYFGRDVPGMHQRDVSSPPVDAEMDQTLWHHPSGKIVPQPNNDTLIFAQSSALLVIACKIVNVANALSPTGTMDTVQIEDQVTKVDLQLNNWKGQLPPQLDITLANRARSTPHRLMLHIVYWWCLIVLHRPFFGPRPQHIPQGDPAVDHVKLCTRAADHILDLVESWRGLYSLRMVPPTLVQIVFHAATISLLRALQATGSPRIAYGGLDAALAQVELCTRYLDEMRVTWNCASIVMNTLLAIVDNKLRPVIARRLARKGELTLPKYFGARDQRLRGPEPSTSVLPPLEPSASPAPISVASQWNLPGFPDLYQSLDALGQTQNLTIESTDGVGFDDANMTALLPSYDFLGSASEFWPIFANGEAPAEFPQNFL